MIIRTTLAATIAAFALSTIDADAQSRLSRNQIVGSLQGTVSTVQGIDAEDLRRQAIERIRAENTESTVDRRPIAVRLSKLRQFNIEVNFDFDSAAIRPKSYRTVGLIADALHHPNLLSARFLIVGHTDSKGSREYNLNLSQKRAESIREALVTTFRIEPDRVIALGLGEEQLQDPKNPEGAVNRRVQLINVGSYQAR